MLWSAFFQSWLDWHHHGHRRLWHLIWTVLGCGTLLSEWKKVYLSLKTSTFFLEDHWHSVHISACGTFSTICPDTSREIICFSRSSFETKYFLFKSFNSAVWNLRVLHACDRAAGVLRLWLTLEDGDVVFFFKRKYLFLYLSFFCFSFFRLLLNFLSSWWSFFLSFFDLKRPWACCLQHNKAQINQIVVLAIKTKN